MKKVSILFISTLLFLAGCVQDFNSEEEVVQEDEEVEGQRSIVPNYRLSDENYRMILPYRTSEARGVIVHQMGNRLDIDEMEQGLRRHSIEYFDPEEYYFEEGQYLSSSQIFNWISELNPQIDEDEWEEEDYRDNPRQLTHILEQNFLQKSGDQSVELKGISIGIALKSVYRFHAENKGPYFEDIPLEDTVEKGEEIAQTVLERLRDREELRDIPIMFALYREEEQGSAVPGNFISKTLVRGGDMMIDSWEPINEENILFPSSEADTKYYDDAQMIKSFGNDVAEFFPNYVGVIGKGFYINEQLQKLTLEIPIEFHGKGEILGFSQYAYSLVKEKFTGDYYDLEINITSSQGQEALIFRAVGESEPTVHVYH